MLLCSAICPFYSIHVIFFLVDFALLISMLFSFGFRSIHAYVLSVPQYFCRFRNIHVLLTRSFPSIDMLFTCGFQNQRSPTNAYLMLAISE